MCIQLFFALPSLIVWLLYSVIEYVLGGRWCEGEKYQPARIPKTCLWMWDKQTIAKLANITPIYSNNYDLWYLYHCLTSFNCSYSIHRVISQQTLYIYIMVWSLCQTFYKWSAKYQAERSHGRCRVGEGVVIQWLNSLFLGNSTVDPWGLQVQLLVMFLILLLLLLQDFDILYNIVHISKIYPVCATVTMIILMINRDYFGLLHTPHRPPRNEWIPISPQRPQLDSLRHLFLQRQVMWVFFSRGGYHIYISWTGMMNMIWQIWQIQYHKIWWIWLTHIDNITIQIWFHELLYDEFWWCNQLWLVVGLFFSFFHIVGIIIPTD